MFNPKTIGKFNRTWVNEIYIKKHDSIRTAHAIRRSEEPRQPSFIFRVLYCNDYIVVYEELRLEGNMYKRMNFYEAHGMCGPAKFRREFREAWFELTASIEE